MQGLIQNSVAGVLAAGASGGQSAVMEPSKTQPTAFSEILGGVAEEPWAPVDALVSTPDLDNNFELIGFTGQERTDSGGVFPLEGQELSTMMMETISNSDQQQDNVVQGFIETSEHVAQLDMTAMSEQQALINLAQVQAPSEVQTAYSAMLNGGVQQQQIRNSLNQSDVIEDKRTDRTAPLIGEASLLSENELFSTPNSAKLVDALLRIGEPSVSHEKLITNESGLSVQSLSALRSGVGEPTSPLGVMNSLNIDKAVALTEIKTPMNNSEWKADLGERVAWMANNKISAAEIKINPSHLGPIDIKVSVNNEQQATVSMIASHGATREALEAAIPRLRDILSDAGLQLADADVNSQHPEQGEHQASEGADAMNGAQQKEPSEVASNEIHITPISSIQNTGIDIFA